MKSLEELCKEQIIRLYGVGLDELNIGFINFCRDGLKQSRVKCRYLDEWDGILNEEFDIVEFVNSLSGEELLIVMDAQACQKYR